MHDDGKNGEKTNWPTAGATAGQGFVQRRRITSSDVRLGTSRI